MINVTKAYLPDHEKFKSYVDKIYSSGQLTNNGPLLKELEQRLKKYLGVRNIILVSNGSIALHIAYKALGLSGEVITTPFSFVATTSTLAWEGLKPVFSDIDSDTFNLDPSLIRAKISSKTSAILPVHVFGNACKVEVIKEIADENNLKVVYDAAHAFDVRYKGNSVLNYGDLSTVSFHATKLFHTIEGGAIITDNDELAEKIRLLINFGLCASGKIDMIGTNAKMNEFQAAMGLCVLDDIASIKESRKESVIHYRKLLSDVLTLQKIEDYSSENYSYFPVLFNSEETLKRVVCALNGEHIFPRRYFSPSLDQLSYLSESGVSPISRDISSRVLCLPLFKDLSEKEILRIVDVIKVIIKDAN